MADPRQTACSAIAARQRRRMTSLVTDDDVLRRARIAASLMAVWGAVFLAVVTFATLVMMPRSAAADELFWNQGGGGSFGTFSNWMPDTVPDGDDTAQFGLGNATTYTVNFFAARSSDFLQVNNGDVTFQLGGQTYTVTNDVIVAELAGDLATLRISGGTLDSGVGSIGFFPFADGTVEVNGSASEWTLSGGLTIAEFGDGTLDILGGGSVSAASSSLALAGGATGTVNVTGANSTWDLTGNLSVGEFSTGNLNISTGGHVTAGDATFGTIGGAIGNATISGAGAMLTTVAGATFGDFGDADVNVNSSGKLETAGATIGFDGTGVVTVDSGTSSWTNTGTLTVADFGSGTLNITGGATVSNTAAAVGVSGGSTGDVLVSGTGSTWTSTGDVSVGGTVVGAGGTATVDVESAGSMGVTGTLRVWDDGEVATNGGLITATTVDVAGGLLSGSGIVAGNVTNRGNVGPGQSPGTLSIIGNYDQTADGALALEIADTNVNLFDRLSISGAGTLDGSMSVSLLGGFEPEFGDEFQVITANSLSGTFASLTGLDAVPGMYLAPIYEADGMRLVAALPGDTNLDGTVNALDVNILSLNWLSTTATFAEGDLNGDGFVNALDANILSLNFLRTVPGSALEATGVPEPSTLALWAAGLAAWGLRRRRGRGPNPQAHPSRVR